MPLHFPECSWTPKTIRRQIRSVKSSTQVVEVETDAGTAYVKGLGNPQGPESLVFELVGTRLARAVGLPTPDFAVLEHDVIELERSDSYLVEHGPIFASKAIPGSPGGGGAFFDALLNPEAIPLLVAFDTWCANVDRCPPPDYLDPTPNWDNVFFTPKGAGFELIVFDHTHCFAEDDLSVALEGQKFLNDPRVYGLFEEFRPFLSEDNILRSIGKICEVDASQIRQIIEEVPAEWGVGAGSRAIWAEQILARRTRLEAILMPEITSQNRFKF